MFEKDIYQLIRGLRAHKGREREYIQEALRECRKEIRGADMDQKATAMLKLVYLEMFGHDMSWASFNVLEVMSSQKYLQKRVGYLAAVQSFRSDTEVLMLAENLLKKDLGSPDKATIALALVTIPHIISPSMANSLLTDLLPRLSHSNPIIRKKTIVTLYRLALVYPETLRPAWPKIKERLQDENEDPSVTAAIVNVICELGWRRPQDFLPLAPRLFELLTSTNNNWMAIKIIKLFSTLLPLEPRLVKKLLPPMTTIIKTTPAMSLLYECVNGIIQGGILEAVEGTTEGDEIARLCINKLRAMLVVEGDPNLRYVALLAFAKIPNAYADLLAEHQDVVLECIDDPDISIRTRALDLVIEMVDSTSLQTVVERLLKQLRSAGRAQVTNEPNHDRSDHDGITPRAHDEDEERAGMVINPKESRSGQAPPLPDDYRASVIGRILDMCSKNTYASMTDFEWYIGVLVELVKRCPATNADGFAGGKKDGSVADAIGKELLNVAVRVKAIRPEAAAAAQALLLVESRDDLFPAAGSGGYGVLASAAFIAGEFATMLPNMEAVLTSLTHPSTAQLPADVLLSHIQAVPKVFARLAGSQKSSWTQARSSHIILVIARIVHFLEPLALHPNLEVQERAVEFLDLMRLTSEAVSNHKIDEDEEYITPPLLLTQAIPSLFDGAELNPVAPTALKMVPEPDGLDLNVPINDSLNIILQQAEYETDYVESEDEVYKFYNEKPSAVAIGYQHQRPAAELLEPVPRPNRSSSYQDDDADFDEDNLEKIKAERRERYRDDPYYIGASERSSNSSTPLHNILRSANGEALDVDAIPVMELKFDASDGISEPARAIPNQPPPRKIQRHFEIASDETLGGDAGLSRLSSSQSKQAASRGRRTLLEVDSSGLSSLTLDDNTPNGHSQLDFERRQAEEEEMAKAMREVERLRLEMQRAQEQIVSIGDDGGEGTVVVARRRKKKARVAPMDSVPAAVPTGDEADTVVKRKKKKKRRVDEGAAVEATAPIDTAVEADEEQPEAPPPIKTKRKKRRQIVFDEDGGS